MIIPCTSIGVGSRDGGYARGLEVHQPLKKLAAILPGGTLNVERMSIKPAHPPIRQEQTRPELRFDRRIAAFRNTGRSKRGPERTGYHREHEGAMVDRLGDVPLELRPGRGDQGTPGNYPDPRAAPGRRPRDRAGGA